MPLHPTFCGLSVMDWKSSMGWGAEQTSELRVALVQDAEQGDVPAPPPVGTPVYFEFFQFKFAGLLQKWSKKNSQSGLPTFEAVCTDPRDLLRGTQVVIGNYNGGVGGVRNLINVFGWWENNVGFGASLANESGMPWNLIRSGLLTICNSPSHGLYGGPLSYRGFTYGLDLSEMPVPDIDYRVGRGSIGLMDAIAQVCEDGGCDFFVELRGLTIKIRTVGRFSQPPLGTIAQVVDTNWGNVLRSEDGLEARSSEPTSMFLTGGEVCELFQTGSNYASFWGYDLVGRPIVGRPGVWNFFGTAPAGEPAPLLASIPCEHMDLNASGVEDIIGAVAYPCSTLEMRLALVNYESWSAFIWHHRPELRPFIYSPFRNNGGLGLAVQPNVVNDDKVAAVQVGMAGINSDFHMRAQRLYEFVRNYASDFYGKKYLVALPAVLAKQDPDTLKTTYTQEPTDGGWLPEEAAPLGLSPLNQDVFKTGDGRFRSFVGFAGLVGMDLSKVSPSESVVENDSLYLRASVEPGMVFMPVTGQPAALVSFSSAVFQEAVEAAGDNTIMAAVLTMPPAAAQPWLNRQFGPVALRIHPEARHPDAFAIPLKSNVLTYGPWHIAGAPGRVRYESDPTMTPWNYGGWERMNAAGLARVANAATSMQVSETGLLEVAGPPAVSLGDVLQENGPNVTNIDVSYGRDGVTTSYRFATFTPRFGVFSKSLAERIKTLGLVGQELRKAIRAGINQASVVRETVQRAVAGFLANAPKAVVPKTPHQVLVGHAVAESGNGGVRVCPMTATYEEAVGLVGGDSDAEFRSRACMSMDGLLRPFTTRPGSSAEARMPAFVTPSATSGLNALVLNPFPAGNDIAYLATGRTYSRLHSYEAGNDPADTRGLALRGPLVVAGWGYDTDCRPAPGDGEGGWMANVLRRSDQWKVGPVDMLWDERRGVWTSHDILTGTTQGTLPAGGSGLFAVAGYSGWNLTIWNWFSTPVSGETKAMVGYVAPLNRWYIFAADCPGV